MTENYFKYGFITFLTLAGYFLLMSLFGLHDNPVFSVFNAVLYGGGIYLAIRTAKRKTDDFNYWKGLQAGFLSGVVATVLFTAFIAVYMYEIDSSFALNLFGSWGIAYNNEVVTILFSTLLMGMSTAMVCALTFMQRMKTSNNPTSIISK